MTFAQSPPTGPDDVAPLADRHHDVDDLAGADVGITARDAGGPIARAVGAGREADDGRSDQRGADGGSAGAGHDGGSPRY